MLTNIQSIIHSKIFSPHHDSCTSFERHLQLYLLDPRGSKPDQNKPNLEKVWSAKPRGIAIRCSEIYTLPSVTSLTATGQWRQSIVQLTTASKPGKGAAVSTPPPPPPGAGTASPPLLASRWPPFRSFSSSHSMPSISPWRRGYRLCSQTSRGRPRGFADPSTLRTMGSFSSTMDWHSLLRWGPFSSFFTVDTDSRFLYRYFFDLFSSSF